MMRSEFSVVLDTNVLLVSLAASYSYHWVFERLIGGEYELVLTNEILAEYQEQVALRYGLRSADARLDFLLLLPNVTLITPFYRWQLISDDPDDNKFVDCAIAANADFIVTNDRHFRVLERINFPQVRTITVADFQRMLDSLL